MTTIPAIDCSGGERESQSVLFCLPGILCIPAFKDDEQNERQVQEEKTGTFREEPESVKEWKAKCRKSHEAQAE